MVMHRIDDTVLNDEEYSEHIDSNWAGLLFLIGAIVAGISVFVAFDQFNIVGYPKWVKFIAIICAALASGFILAKARDIIRWCIAFLIILALIGGIGYGIWVWI